MSGILTPHSGDPFGSVDENVSTSWLVALGLDDESCGRVIPFQTPGSSMDEIGVPAATRFPSQTTSQRCEHGGQGWRRGWDRDAPIVRSIGPGCRKEQHHGMETRPHVVSSTPGCPGEKSTREGNGARGSCPVSPAVPLDRSKETSARKTTHPRVGRCTAPAELRGKETHVGRTHWKKLSKKERWIRIGAPGECLWI